MAGQGKRSVRPVMSGIGSEADIVLLKIAEQSIKFLGRATRSGLMVAGEAMVVRRKNVAATLCAKRRKCAPVMHGRGNRRLGAFYMATYEMKFSLSEPFYPHRAIAKKNSVRIPATTIITASLKIEKAGSCAIQKPAFARINWPIFTSNVRG